MDLINEEVFESEETNIPVMSQTQGKPPRVSQESDSLTVCFSQTFDLPGLEVQKDSLPPPHPPRKR